LRSNERAAVREIEKNFATVGEPGSAPSAGWMEPFGTRAGLGGQRRKKS